MAWKQLLVVAVIATVIGAGVCTGLTLAIGKAGAPPRGACARFEYEAERERLGRA